MTSHDHHEAPVADLGMVADPVCGMTVDPATARHRFEHGGATFHFCCAGCRGKFAHPEVRQVGPGSCPICGMALEPLTITAEPEANPELRA